LERRGMKGECEGRKRVRKENVMEERERERRM
jgi:hypothetical protein